MTTYFAILHKDPDSSVGVMFPDLPGCFSAGDTCDEAIRNASEALRLYVETMRDLGGPIPEPRSFDTLMADPDVTSEFASAPLVAIQLADEPLDA